MGRGEFLLADESPLHGEITRGPRSSRWSTLVVHAVGHG